MVNKSVALVFGITVYPLLIATAMAQVAEPYIVPAGERQLFLDDVPIAEMDGLTRSLHQAVKKGALIRPDYLGQERHFTARNAPNWDREREVFRFLVTEATKSISTVWESDDGLHWVRVGTSDMVTYTVVYDPTDPDPSRRYKSMNRRRIAVSPDMLTWEVIGNPNITGSDEHNLSFDEKSHVFFFSVKAFFILAQTSAMGMPRLGDDAYTHLWRAAQVDQAGILGTIAGTSDSTARVVKDILA